MAKTLAKLSPDTNTKVGAILLSSEERIIAASYNGYLRKANDNILPKTAPEKYEYFQHAERNLLYNCAYNGISTKNTKVIVTHSPCKDCLRAMFQSGIEEIYYRVNHNDLDPYNYYNLPDLCVEIQTNVDKSTLTRLKLSNEFKKSS